MLHIFSINSIKLIARTLTATIILGRREYKVNIMQVKAQTLCGNPSVWLVLLQCGRCNNLPGRIEG
jgi:hypothetical protein